jgi:hypothetical protein
MKGEGTLEGCQGLLNLKHMIPACPDHAGLTRCPHCQLSSWCTRHAAGAVTARSPPCLARPGPLATAPAQQLPPIRWFFAGTELHTPASPARQHRSQGAVQLSAFPGSHPSVSPGADPGRDWMRIQEREGCPLAPIHGQPALQRRSTHFCPLLAVTCALGSLAQVFDLVRQSVVLSTREKPFLSFLSLVT